MTISTPLRAGESAATRFVRVSRSMRNWLRLALIVVLVGALAVLVIVLTGGDDNGDDADQASTATTPSAPTEAECAPAERPEPKDISYDRPEQVLERGEPAIASVDTSCGGFHIELDTQGSPKTSNSFAFLAEEGVYDGTWFHRIVPGFVIQGGDPGADGTGGPGYTVIERPPSDTSYLRGMVAMAKTSVEPPGASGSQFFVVTAPADADLPAQYAVLGEVVEGMDVVSRIARLGDPADPNGTPLEPVVIETVTIERG
jgi:peptidyl-prolyl cis-trans isomerase B (cyclophilin B)